MNEIASHIVWDERSAMSAQKKGKRSKGIMRIVLIGLVASQIIGCDSEYARESESTSELTTVIVQDSFTGSGTLTAHQPDVGTGWVKVYDTLLNDPVVSGVLKAKSNGTNKGQAYAAQPAPTSADEQIQIKLTALDTSSSARTVGLFGRRVDNNNLYFLRVSPNGSSNPSLQLYKRVASVNTLIASIDSTLVAGDVIMLELRNSAKKIFRNGTEVASSTDNALTAAGTWGVSLGAYPTTPGDIRTTWSLDDFTASQITTPAPDAGVDAPPPPPDAPVADAGTSSCPGCTGTIAFVSDRDGNKEIYTINADGTNLTRLTNNTANDDDPTWSPDGQRIAFSSSRDGNDELYVMNADGSNVTQLTFTSAPERSYQPAWSPDGTTLVYSYEAPAAGYWADLYVVGANAGGPPPSYLFGTTQGFRGFEQGAVWSPDGSTIAFTSDYYYYDGTEDVFLINADGTNWRSITDHTFDTFQDTWPHWSHAGNKFAINRYGKWQQSSTIGVMNTDGTGFTQIATGGGWCAQTGGCYYAKPAWSPDDQVIAYTAGQATHDIRWVTANGASSGLIVSNGWSPSWKP